VCKNTRRKLTAVRVVVGEDANPQRHPDRVSEVD